MPTFADLHLSALANLHLVYTHVATSIVNLQLQVDDLRSHHHQAQQADPSSNSSSNSSATTIVDCSPARVQGSEATTICVDCNHRASSHAKNCAKLEHFTSNTSHSDCYCDFCDFTFSDGEPVCNCGEPVRKKARLNVIDLTQPDLEDLVKCVNNSCEPGCDFCNFAGRPICNCPPIYIDLTQPNLSNLRDYHTTLRQTTIYQHFN
jgi:hypothetical protein